MRRAQILVRLVPRDAARVRKEASSAFRSVSGYLLYVLERGFRVEQILPQGLSDALVAKQVRATLDPQVKKLRTTLHLRCSINQAEKIRTYAARRGLSISDFVVFSLHRVWSAAEEIHEH